MGGAICPNVISRVVGDPASRSTRPERRMETTRDSGRRLETAGDGRGDGFTLGWLADYSSVDMLCVWYKSVNFSVSSRAGDVTPHLGARGRGDGWRRPETAGDGW